MVSASWSLRHLARISCLICLPHDLPSSANQGGCRCTGPRNFATKGGWQGRRNAVKPSMACVRWYRIRIVVMDRIAWSLIQWKDVPFPKKVGRRGQHVSRETLHWIRSVPCAKTAGGYGEGRSVVSPRCTCDRNASSWPARTTSWTRRTGRRRNCQKMPRGSLFAYGTAKRRSGAEGCGQFHVAPATDMMSFDHLPGFPRPVSRCLVPHSGEGVGSTFDVSRETNRMHPSQARGGVDHLPNAASGGHNPPFYPCPRPTNETATILKSV